MRRIFKLKFIWMLIMILASAMVFDGCASNKKKKPPKPGKPIPCPVRDC